MKKLIYSLRQATRNRFTNYLKIASLALGIAIGGLAIARYTFHSSFEKNLENFDQINFLTMDWTINNDQTYSQSTYTMEPMGRTMVEQIPSVESAVAFFDNFTYTYELGEKQFDLNTLELCNETFFDVFPYPILSGDPHQIFDDQALIMVSQSTANKLSENGDVMDLTIKIKDHLYTIKGVYEDFPSNSRFYGTEVMVHKKYDWGGWQSDAFQTFFTLNREISQEELDAQIKQAFAPHLENHKSAGIQVECHSFHIKEYAKVTEGSNLGNNIYLILGVLLIIISSFNFALMQINSLSTRAIEVAIHKVNGAKRRDLFMLVMWETLYYIIMAVLLAILVARVLKTPAEAVLGRYEEILNLRGLWSIGAALLLITLIAGVLPALIFIRIPALHIFSKSRLNNLWWKNGLLYIQMFVTIIVGTMTIVIIMQFRMMTTLDLGYSTDNLHITSLRDVSAEKGHLLKEKLLSTSGVVGACYTDQNIVEQLSGRTLMNQGQSEVALSCRELAADEDFFWTYQVPLIEGDSTTLHSDGRKSYMVCQEVLRKTVSTIGEYNFYSNGLEGVFGSIRGNLYLPVQPLILYPIREDCTTRILTIRTTPSISDADIENIYQVIRATLDDPEIEVSSYQDMVEEQYSEIADIRNMASYCAAILILIIFMGITSYLATDIKARQREIAIRRTHGATTSQITTFTARRMLIVLLISAATAIPASYFVANFALQSFIDRIDLAWYIFVPTTIITLAIVLATSYALIYKIAHYDYVRIIGRK